MKTAFRNRWKLSQGLEFIQALERHARSGNGYEIKESPFGIVPESGRLDLRGAIFPSRIELRRIILNNADLTSAVIDGAWIESSTFVNLFFDGSSVQNLAEHANKFVGCKFYDTDLRCGHFGYRGSKFTLCCFERVDFRRCGFVRPEFDDCWFIDCIFDGVDFAAGSFRKCEFKGIVRGVWFRGGFPLSSDAEEHGEPRHNKMEQVSFKDALLLDVTFSDNCDLSSVIVPSDGKHALFDNWPFRIRTLFDRSRGWPEPARRAAEKFYRSCEIHAKKQQYYVIGLEELVKLFGAEAGAKVWEELQRT